MPALKLALFIGLSSLSANALSYGFYDRFPSCKVFQESNCNSVYDTVGYRMSCYRNFLERKKSCIEKTTRLFKEWEAANKKYEDQKRAEVKQNAVQTIDSNYIKYTNTKIAEQDLRTIDKFEGAEILRGMLSYINRQPVPQTKTASDTFDALLKEAEGLMILRSQGDETFNTKLASFTEKHRLLSQKINVITKNYQTYFDFYRPKVLGLRFQENIQNTLDTLEATRFLIINAYEMETALPGMLEQLQINAKSDSINKMKVKTATKREIILQKLYQARVQLKVSKSSEAKKNLEFLLKLCSFEFPDDRTVCENTGVQE